MVVVMAAVTIAITSSRVDVDDWGVVHAEGSMRGEGEWGVWYIIGGVQRCIGFKVEVGIIVETLRIVWELKAWWCCCGCSSDVERDGAGYVGDSLV